MYSTHRQYTGERKEDGRAFLLESEDLLKKVIFSEVEGANVSQLIINNFSV
jgi:hypothetical protein